METKNLSGGINGQKMKILHLTLKKKWFDMIASGEKKEEYRELKVYWADRLCSKTMCNELFGMLYDIEDNVSFIKFDAVKCVNGYGNDKPSITLQCKGVIINYGKPEWGAEPGKEYFVIKLGEIINSSSLK